MRGLLNDDFATPVRGRDSFRALLNRFDVERPAHGPRRR